MVKIKNRDYKIIAANEAIWMCICILESLSYLQQDDPRTDFRVKKIIGKLKDLKAELNVQIQEDKHEKTNTKSSAG